MVTSPHVWTNDAGPYDITPPSCRLIGRHGSRGSLTTAPVVDNGGFIVETGGWFPRVVILGLVLPTDKILVSMQRRAVVGMVQFWPCQAQIIPIQEV